MNAKSFERLANEKDVQRNAAIASEQDATEQTRESRLNLLAAELSDARGWSTSFQAGQRVEGMKSLRRAITLARELDVFEQHQDEINQTAASLSTLHDAPIKTEWTHPFVISDRIGFSADLSHYACMEDRDSDTTCKVYRVAENMPTLVDSIPTDRNFAPHSIRLSADANFAAAAIWRRDGYWSPWIYNRHSKESRILDIELTKKRAFIPRTMSEFYGNVIYLVSEKSTLLALDCESGKVVHEIELPAEGKWTRLAVNKDASLVAVYDKGSKTLLIVDCVEGSLQKMSYEQQNSPGVAWLHWQSVARVWTWIAGPNQSLARSATPKSRLDDALENNRKKSHSIRWVNATSSRSVFWKGFVSSDALFLRSCNDFFTSLTITFAGIRPNRDLLFDWCDRRVAINSGDRHHLGH